MSSEETHHNVVVTPPDKDRIRKIWKVALILGIITAIEFLFAFTMPRGVLLIFIFIGLTLIKAFYIVAEFMHLRHEVKVLIWSILIPTVFIIWLIIALIVDGAMILDVRY